MDYKELLKNIYTGCEALFIGKVNSFHVFDNGISVTKYKDNYNYLNYYKFIIDNEQEVMLNSNVFYDYIPNEDKIIDGYYLDSGYFNFYQQYKSLDTINYFLMNKKPVLSYDGYVLKHKFNLLTLLYRIKTLNLFEPLVYHVSLFKAQQTKTYTLKFNTLSAVFNENEFELMLNSINAKKENNDIINILTINKLFTQEQK